MRCLAPFILGILATPAGADSVSESLPLETFYSGVLVGLATPYIGLIHLVIVLAMGAAAALSGRMLFGIIAYVTAMLLAAGAAGLGMALHVQQGLTFGALILLAGLISSARAPGTLRIMAVFAGFGALHGAVFFMDILGPALQAGSGALFGYTLGIGLTQVLLAMTAALLTTRMRPMPVRLASAGAAAVALLLCFGIAEAALLG